jgi:hypothetical protein
VLVVGPPRSPVTPAGPFSCPTLGQEATRSPWCCCRRERSQRGRCGASSLNNGSKGQGGTPL